MLLPGADVVAKVATGHLDGEREHTVQREVEIAAQLVERAAPIVPPLPGAAAGPLEVDGSVLTLWTYRVAVSPPHDSGPRLAAALSELHAALAGIATPLPSFAERVFEAAALFADADATPGLARSDRTMLAGVYDDIAPMLHGVRTVQPLHGEPHSGNLLWTSDGPLFIDFEAVCSGPREWDFSFLPPDALAAFDDYDDELLLDLGVAVSYCVAAWCSAQPGRAPGVDEAAAFHLGRLKRRVTLQAQPPPVP